MSRQGNFPENSVRIASSSSDLGWVECTFVEVQRIDQIPGQLHAAYQSQVHPNMSVL